MSIKNLLLKQRNWWFKNFPKKNSQSSIISPVELRIPQSQLEMGKAWSFANIHMGGLLRPITGNLYLFGDEIIPRTRLNREIPILWNTHHRTDWCDHQVTGFPPFLSSLPAKPWGSRGFTAISILKKWERIPIERCSRPKRKMIGHCRSHCFDSSIKQASFIRTSSSRIFWL